MATYGGAVYGEAPYAGQQQALNSTQGIIFNTIRTPAGAPVSGVVVTATLIFVGAGFRVASGTGGLIGTEVTAQVTTTSDVNGYWALVLEKNSNILPSNTHYEVNENVDASIGGSRNYYITVSQDISNLQGALVTALT